MSHDGNIRSPPKTISGTYLLKHECLNAWMNAWMNEWDVILNVSCLAVFTSTLFSLSFQGWISLALQYTACACSCYRSWIWKACEVLRTHSLHSQPQLHLGTWPTLVFVPGWAWAPSGFEDHSVRLPLAGFIWSGIWRANLQLLVCLLCPCYDQTAAAPLPFKGLTTALFHVPPFHKLPSPEATWLYLCSLVHGITAWDKITGTFPWSSPSE